DTIRGEIENIKEVAEELSFSEGTQQWATEKITKYRSELEKISTTATDKLVEGIDNITAAQRRVVQKTIEAGELGKAKDYLDTIVEGAEAEGVKAGTDMAKGFKESFTESMGGGQSIPAPTVMFSGVIKKETEKTKLELQGLSNTINSLNFDIGNKMFPPGSLGALQGKLAVLREQLLYATNPATVQRLKNQISLTREEMNKFSNSAVEAGDRSAMAMGSLGNAIGGVIGKLIRGKEEALSFGNILASVAPALINILT